MRAIGVLVLLTAAASADPATGAATPKSADLGAIRIGPTKVIEVAPWTPPARVTTRSPGITGQPANGIVIDPGGSSDGRPWPYGIWIRPPETGDRNVVVLGTDSLPFDDLALPGKLTRTFDLGMGSFLEWLMTPRIIRKP